MLTATTAVIVSALTAAVLLFRHVNIAYRSPQLHVALETFDTCTAAAVTLLFIGRHRRSRGSLDLRLAGSFLLLALIGAYVVVLPPSLSDNSLASVWLPTIGRLLAAGGIAFATSSRRRQLSTAPTALALAGTAAAFVAAALISALAPIHLPQPVDTFIDPSSAPQISLRSGNLALLVTQFGDALVYLLAAVSFARRAVPLGDMMILSLGPACVFAAAARVNYAFFPTIFSPWIYTGDIFRSLFYVTLLVGALGELRHYWAAQAEAAVFEERRRLARDLHDGTVQELGYIRTLSHSLRLESKRKNPQVDRIAAAADRALAEARQAIHALSVPLDEPIEDLMRNATTEVADRFDVDVEVNARDVYISDYAVRNALVRIAREAVSNAARHGGATRVRIHIETARMDIVDNGSGFEPRTQRQEGFGLVSMKDRAESIGGQLRIRRFPNSGMAITVHW